MQTMTTDIDTALPLIAMFVNHSPISAFDTTDICGGPSTGMSADPQLVARLFSRRTIEVQPLVIAYDARQTNFNDMPPLEDETAQDPDPRDDFKDEVALLAPEEEPLPRTQTPPVLAERASNSTDIRTMIESAYNTMLATYNCVQHMDETK